MTLPMVAMSALNQSADFSSAARERLQWARSRTLEIEYPLFRFFGERPRSAKPQGSCLALGS